MNACVVVCACVLTAARNRGRLLTVCAQDSGSAGGINKPEHQSETELYNTSMAGCNRVMCVRVSLCQ